LLSGNRFEVSVSVSLQVAAREQLDVVESTTARAVLEKTIRSTG
jgi:hypothetical protein